MNLRFIWTHFVNSEGNLINTMGSSWRSQDLWWGSEEIFWECDLSIIGTNILSDSCILAGAQIAMAFWNGDPANQFPAFGSRHGMLKPSLEAVSGSWLRADLDQTLVSCCHGVCDHNRRLIKRFMEHDLCVFTDTCLHFGLTTLEDLRRIIVGLENTCIACEPVDVCT